MDVRLILRQRRAVLQSVRNVTSQAPAPHRTPVPASAVPRTRAALTDVLLTPVLHPVVRLFVPLVIRNRSPVPPPVRVLLLLRLPVRNLSNPPNLRKLNVKECIRIMMIARYILVVGHVLVDISECLLLVMTITIMMPLASPGNRIW